VKHADFQKCHDSANRFASALRQQLGARVLGPEPPLVSRVRNNFIQTITLKIERTNISIAKVKDLIRSVLLDFELDKSNSGIRVQVDVDPY
jgi:primosomal protein N' (replication factor Y)